MSDNPLDGSIDTFDEATVVNPDDMLYIVQNGEDKFVKFSTIVSSWPTTTTTTTVAPTTAAPTTTAGP